MNHFFQPPDLPEDRIIACFGLISDTHMPQRWPQLPLSVNSIFDGVDLIFHAGDVGKLWVLDRLSAISPVIAVHGNDETEEAQRGLPYQQVIAAGGYRLLLCHGHLPDRKAEMASRIGDDWESKLAQRARQADDVGASIMVFGHLHIPFVRHFDGIWLINPGAIASGNFITRQTRQTIALLYLRDDGLPFVTHVDLGQPDRPYQATVDWPAGFAAAGDRYSATIIDQSVAGVMAAMRDTPYYSDARSIGCFSRLSMKRWLGDARLITVEELRAAYAAETAFTDSERIELLALIDMTR